MKVEIIKRTYLSSSLELKTEFQVFFSGKKEEEEIVDYFYLNGRSFDTIEEAEGSIEKVKKALELARLSEEVLVKEIEF
jgi:hypothetical protein